MTLGRHRHRNTGRRGERKVERYESDSEGLILYTTGVKVTKGHKVSDCIE